MCLANRFESVKDQDTSTQAQWFQDQIVVVAKSLKSGREMKNTKLKRLRDPHRKQRKELRTARLELGLAMIDGKTDLAAQRRNLRSFNVGS